MTSARIAALTALLLLVPGCRREEAGASPAAAPEAARPRVLPAPPFPLPVPPMPSPDGLVPPLDDDERDYPGAAAMEAASSGDYARAAVLQGLAVATAGRGRYNLACFDARRGAVDEAIYWLQQAALQEGVDASWAAVDSDLASLRADARWGRIRQFLAECRDYWAQSGREDLAVVGPRAGSGPFPTLLGLHGLGGDATGFFREEDYRPLADVLGVAFIAVSGTVPLGPSAFSWAEDPVRDLAHLDRGLEAAKGRTAVDPKKLILLGFSQGAAVAAELAARHPERFAGPSSCRRAERSRSDSTASRRARSSRGADSSSSAAPTKVPSPSRARGRRARGCAARVRVCISTSIAASARTQSHPTTNACCRTGSASSWAPRLRRIPGPQARAEAATPVNGTRSAPTRPPALASPRPATRPSRRRESAR